MGLAWKMKHCVNSLLVIAVVLAKNSLCDMNRLSFSLGCCLLFNPLLLPFPHLQKRILLVCLKNNRWDPTKIQSVYKYWVSRYLGNHNLVYTFAKTLLRRYAGINGCSCKSAMAELWSMKCFRWHTVQSFAPETAWPIAKANCAIYTVWV